MKNLFFTLALMLIGTFAFANSLVLSDIDLKKTQNALFIDAQEELLSCTSRVVKSVTTHVDGSQTTKTTTTVICDTPQELADYHAAVKKLE